MPEILTESFCERCGTRYTFESAVPRTTRLKGVRVLSRGLKNFVMSDDTSLDEAMAAARSDTDREATSQQLDAFHKTFNFCMHCRQYTCANCWNETEGRCLTCAPHLGHEILPAPFPDLDVSTGIAFDGNGHPASNGHDQVPTLDVLAWPTSDRMHAADEATPGDPFAPAADGDFEIEEIDALARLTALGGAPQPAAEAIEPTAEAIEPAQALDEAIEPAAEAMQPAQALDDAVVRPTTPATHDVGARAAAAAAATSELLRKFRPGQNLDAEIAAYEVEQATRRPTPDPAPEPVVAQPEPVVAEVEPTPEPVRADDLVEQPTWHIVAPDPSAPTQSKPTSPAPAVGPDVPHAAGGEPQWPSQPQWPSPQANAGLPFLGRPATPSGGIDALWAESAREVGLVPTAGAATPDPGGPAPRVAGAVQPCVSCGLSLSATARFCRRCGTRQD